MRASLCHGCYRCSGKTSKPNWELGDNRELKNFFQLRKHWLQQEEGHVASGTEKNLSSRPLSSAIGDPQEHGSSGTGGAQSPAGSQHHIPGLQAQPGTEQDFSQDTGCWSCPGWISRKMWGEGRISLKVGSDSVSKHKGKGHSCVCCDNRTFRECNARVCGIVRFGWRSKQETINEGTYRPWNDFGPCPGF